MAAPCVTHRMGSTSNLTRSDPNRSRTASRRACSGGGVDFSAEAQSQLKQIVRFVKERS